MTLCHLGQSVRVNKHKVLAHLRHGDALGERQAPPPPPPPICTAFGNYSVIAGHLDGDEPARVAMAREAAEEAGLQVDLAELRFVHVMHRKEAGEPDERIDLFFAATHWQGQPTIREPEKCSELRWSPLDDLPPNVVPYIRTALEHVRYGRHYSEFWSEA